MSLMTDTPVVYTCIGILLMADRNNSVLVLVEVLLVVDSELVARL